MSSGNTSSTAAIVDASTNAESPQGQAATQEEGQAKLGLIDRLTERASEWFNPILVKEARQALKSRQFLITFVLVLVSGWGWSFLAVTIYSPDIFYQPYGADLMKGYFWILAFPLFVMVPFGAFRSLAIEIEDGTFELVSVSTLKPRQIISGKLASALLQMMVYFSGLLPCVAFTYMLRGIEFNLIWLLLASSAFVSIVFSVTGLLLATVSSQKSWQLVISVGFVLLLFVTFGFSGWWVNDILRSSQYFPFEEPMFWASVLAIVTVVGSYAWLFYDSAAARITFPSENRSTRLRITMLGQQVLIVAWCCYVFVLTLEPWSLGLMLFCTAGHWMIMGAMMIGESANISQRSRRTLPESNLGQVLLTWFTPGPYTGYQFAVLNMLGIALFANIVSNLAESRGVPFDIMESEILHSLGFVAAAYLAFYFGIARMIIAALARVTQTGPMLGFLIAALVILVGTLLPTVARTSLEMSSRDPVAFWEITNPVAIIREHLFQFTLSASERNTLRIGVYVIGGIAFLAISVIGAWQVKLKREDAPDRVIDDERELGRAADPVPSFGAHPLDD